MREHLRKISHHYIKAHALHPMQFCDTVRGIHGATPFETVHTIQLGWYVYLLNAFFKQKKIKVQARGQYLNKKRKQQLENTNGDADFLGESTIYEANTDAAPSSRLTSTVMLRLLGKLCKIKVIAIFHILSFHKA